MNFRQQLALNAYYYGSLPLRAWCKKSRGAPVCVLFYHRVADAHPNPWTIPTRQFIRQMKWLRSRFELVSLEEAQRRIRLEWNDVPTVSITFDDGYADNCTHALPWLIERDIPLTYFVASRFVLENKAFPHDIAHGVRLSPNTPEQLAELAEQGVEIGAHTRTHADLGKITDKAQLCDEVLGGARELAEMVGRPMRYFAFPFGLHENMQAYVFELARRERWRGVCSAYGGYNFAGDDAFHLQRIHGDPEMVRLKNWLTVDPRKVAAERRYQYQRLACSTPSAAVGAISS